MGFSRQEYWSGLPCPPPEDLPNPGIKPTSLSSPALAGGFFTNSTTCIGLANPINMIVFIGCVSHPSGYFSTYLFFKTLQSLFIFDCAGSSLLREGFL